MNPEIKAQWVTALRSGEYVQGRKLLRSNTDEFCCLGVLCEIAVANDVIPAPLPGLGGSYLYIHDRSAVLPNEVQEWTGLENSLPYELVMIDDEEIAMDLASLNDGGVPFDQIADVINYFF